MTKRIIYKNDEGGVSFLSPSEKCNLTLEQIAGKDVPSGKRYKIVDVTEIPTDRTFRDAWVVDESELTDGIGWSDETTEEFMASLYVKEAIIQILSAEEVDPQLKSEVVEINRKLEAKEITAVEARQLIVDAHQSDTMEA